MDRSYREVGRSSLIGDYDDYRSYNRQGGESSYVDRDPPQRESYSAGLGRSSYGYGHDRDMVETIMQQHALKQQLSIRESQLALASNLLQQQQQHQQQEFFLQKRRMDSRDRFSRDDFKRPRMMMDSRPRHRSRSSGTSGRDSGPGGRGGRGGSNYRRNQSSPRGSSEVGRRHDMTKKVRKPRSRGRKAGTASNLKETDGGDSGRKSSGSSKTVKSGTASDTNTHTSGAGSPTNTSVTNTPQDPGRSRSPKESYDPEKPTADYDGKVRCKSCNVECKDDEDLKKHLATKEHRERVDHLKNRGSKNHCNICDVELKGSFLQHQRMTFHKKRHIQVTKGCAWCKVTSFKNFTEVLEHRATESHIKNQKLYDKRKKGSEKSSTDSKRSDSRSRKEREPIKVVLPPELEKFDEKVVTGQACVIAVTGWFCKVCNKFYNNESAAKETHCMSELHFNNYKKFMHAKLKAKAEAERDAKEKAEEEEQKKKEAEAEEEKMEEGTEESAEQTGEGETKEGTEGGVENARGGEEAGEEGGEGEEEEEETGEEEEGGAGEEVLDEPEDEYVDDEDLAATEESLCEPSTEAKGDQSGTAEVENAEAMSQEEEPAPAATDGTIEAEGGEEEEEEEEEEEQEPEEVKKVTRSSPSRGRGGRGANRARRGRRVVK